MGITLEKFARCNECGWHDLAMYMEDVEVASPSDDVDPDWRSESVCPECGSSDVNVWMDEL